MAMRRGLVKLVLINEALIVAPESEYSPIVLLAELATNMSAARTDCIATDAMRPQRRQENVNARIFSTPFLMTNFSATWMTRNPMLIISFLLNWVQ
jgi:hypothetical protein